MDKKISELKESIIELKEEKHKLQRQYDLVINYPDDKPYPPTVANKEAWEEYGRPPVISEWNKQKGRLIVGDDGTIEEYKTVGTEQIIDEREEFERFAEEYFFNMTREDWLAFYDKRIRMKERDIEKLEINIERENNSKNIPEYVERAIHEVALEIAKNSPKNDYDTIADALKLYRSTDLNQKEAAKREGIKQNTFNTWKTKLDAKL